MKRAHSFFICMSLLAAAGVGVGATGRYRAPRTSWGDPVIEGLYTNNTDVPFERPPELGDKAFFTREEYEARKRQARRDAATLPGTAADVHYDTGQFGLTPEQADMVQNLRTSIITQPSNGRLPPLNAAAKRRSDEAARAQQGHAYDSYENRPLGERCVIWPHEGPPLRPVAYNTMVRIAQTKDYVVFMTEMVHDARIIPLAKHRPDFKGLARWQGNSWGHWEGDTLVIETTGITDRTTPRGSNIGMGPDAKVIERITRTGAKTLLYQFAVTDPGLWDVGWGGEFPMEVTAGPMFEYACHEGNYGIANTLRGARAEEDARAH